MSFIDVWTQSSPVKEEEVGNVNLWQQETKGFCSWEMGRKVMGLYCVKIFYEQEGMPWVSEQHG